MSDTFDPYHKWLGISPDDQPPDYYRLLGLRKFECDLDVIENAADRQMAHVRTFQAGPHAAYSQQLLNEISAARVCLLSAEQRAQYDTHLQSQVAPPAPIALQPIPPPAQVAPQSSPSTQAIARPLNVQVPASSKPRHQRSTSSSLPLVVAGGVVAFVCLVGVAIGAWWSFQRPSPGPAPVPGQLRTNDGVVETPAENASPVEQISQTPQVVDPPKQSPQVDQSKLRRQFALGHGFVGPRFSLCQDMPMSTFREVIDPLNAMGQVPVRIRPVLDEDGTIKVAAIFHKEARKFKVAINVRRSELLALDEQHRRAGLWPVDACVYKLHQHEKTKDRKVVYSAVWSDLPAGMTETSLVAGVLGQKTEAAWVEMRDRDMQPIRSTRCFVEPGRIVIAMIYGNPPSTSTAFYKSSFWQVRQRLESCSRVMDVNVRASDRNINRVDVCGLKGTSQPFTQMHGLTVQAHMVKCMELMRLGYEPIAISAAPSSISRRWTTISVWNWNKQGTPPKPVSEDATSLSRFASEEKTSTSSDSQPATNVVTAPNTPSSSQQPPVPTPSVTPKSPSPKTVSPPSDDEITSAIAEVREILTTDYRQANMPAEKVSLAHKLRTLSAEEQPSATRFAMLEESARLAAEGHNFTLSSFVVDELAYRFTVDKFQRKFAMFKLWSQRDRAKGTQGYIATEAQVLIDDFVEGNRFDLVPETIEIGRSAAGRSGDKDLRDKLNSLQASLKDKQTAWRAYDAATKTLSTRPQDPQANEAAGIYLAFYRQDWVEGTKHLALTSTATLAQAAQAEAAIPTEVASQKKLADLWYEVGKVERSHQAGAWGRSLHWYKLAIANASGITKKLIEKKIDELADYEAEPPVPRVEPRMFSLLESEPGEVQRLQHADRHVTRIEVSPSGRLAAVCSTRSIEIWDLSTCERLQSISTHRNYGVALTDRVLYAATDARELSAYDVRTGELFESLETEDWIKDVIASPRCSQMFVAFRSDKQQNGAVLDLRTGKIKHEINLRLTPEHVAFAVDGSIAVAADSKNHLKIIDADSGALRKDLGEHDQRIRQMVLAPDSTTLAIVDSVRASLWDVKKGKIADAADLPPRCVRFTNDGRYVVVGGRSGLSILNAKDLTPHTTLKVNGRSSRSIEYLEMLPDPRGALASISGGEVVIFRLPTD